MKRLLFMVTLAAAVAMPAVQAHAGGQTKYFVCKYVGKPGVHERLQTGQNPIDVAASAIDEDPVQVGSYFADAQGRSFVLAEDTGQADPDVSDCPAPIVPFKVTIRMTGQGLVRERFHEPSNSDVAFALTGLDCAAGKNGNKITAGFDGHIGKTDASYGPYTSHHGPVLRVQSEGSVVLKVKASESC